VPLPVRAKTKVRNCGTKCKGAQYVIKLTHDMYPHLNFFVSVNKLPEYAKITRPFSDTKILFYPKELQSAHKLM
jgi:hypothetical protein